MNAYPAPEIPVILLSIVTFASAYLSGSIPVAWLIARWATGKDLRRMGSGNVGVMNTALSVARWAGLIAFLGEITKGVLVVVYPPLLGADETMIGLGDCRGRYWHSLASLVGIQRRARQHRRFSCLRSDLVSEFAAPGGVLDHGVCSVQQVVLCHEGNPHSAPVHFLVCQPLGMVHPHRPGAKPALSERPTTLQRRSPADQTALVEPLGLPHQPAAPWALGAVTVLRWPRKTIVKVILILFRSITLFLRKQKAFLLGNANTGHFYSVLTA